MYIYLLWREGAVLAAYSSLNDVHEALAATLHRELYSITILLLKIKS